MASTGRNLTVAMGAAGYFLVLGLGLGLAGRQGLGQDRRGGFYQEMLAWSAP